MIELYFDGACEPINPGGTASYGWLLKEGKKVIEEGSGIIGTGEGMTNNVAEYYGLIEGLKAYKKLKRNDGLEIRGDSTLVINMVKKAWGWNKKKTVWRPHDKMPHLKDLLDQVHFLLDEIPHNLEWIPREENWEADALSKRHLTS